MSNEGPDSANKVYELNTEPAILSMLEAVDGLSREDARFLIMLNQKIGNDELGNLLFGLRHVLSVIADPEQFIREIDNIKNYGLRLYDEFHAKRQSKGRAGVVTDDEKMVGSLLPEVLNLDREAFIMDLNEKYSQETEASTPDYIHKAVAADIIKATDALMAEERNRLYQIFGIRNISETAVLFEESLVVTPQLAEKHSEFVRNVAASLSKIYKREILNNPGLDPAMYQRIVDDESTDSTDTGPSSEHISRMPTESLVLFLITKNLNKNMRRSVLDEFLQRCRSEMSQNRYIMFERQIRELVAREDWRGIVELSKDTIKSQHVP